MSELHSLIVPALITLFLACVFLKLFSFSLYRCTCTVSFLSSLNASFSIFLVFLLISFSSSFLSLQSLSGIKSSSINGANDGSAFGFYFDNSKYVKDSLCFASLTFLPFFHYSIAFFNSQMIIGYYDRPDIFSE